MPRITFKPGEKTIDVAAGTELLDAIRLAGSEIESSCGGEGTCGRCRVKLIAGKVESENSGVLSAADMAEGFRLACLSRVGDTDLILEIPEPVLQDDESYLNNIDETGLCQTEEFSSQVPVDPWVVKSFLKVEPARLEDGLADLDRLHRALKIAWGDQRIICPLAVVTKLAQALRKENGYVTVTLLPDETGLHLLDIEPGNTSQRSYGLAIDVGTTTVAAQLVSLTSAKVAGTATTVNDQIPCGQDVISRINYAGKPERLNELRNRVITTINRLIDRLCHQHEMESREINSLVVAGNTTMMHLLLGLNPDYIRLAPYTPTLLGVSKFSAGEMGLNVHPQAAVYISPGVGSYVGGDITAGLLCTDIANNTEEINLFIDIGTNGELVLGNRDFLMACACSAGPAFEGGGIKHGMRAVPGAIDKVEVDKKTGVATYQTIGQMPARGICGSGMIALLASLFLSGWVDRKGKLNRTQVSPAIQINGRQANYLIVPAGNTAHGRDIFISENEIENIIRAKAAIYSAMALMLEQSGLSYDRLSHLYIAGGFGRFLPIDQAITIGLLPDLPLDTFRYLGNSSLAGAFRVLVSAEYRQRQIDLARRMTYLELNTNPQYMHQYTGALFLPHTDK